MPETLYDRYGERVNCGRCVYVRIDGKWQWGRHETDGKGNSYIIVEGDRGLPLGKVEGIDWTVTYKAWGGR
jgi:hypothetical protein